MINDSAQNACCGTVPEHMRVLAKLIDSVLNPDDEIRNGFMLLMFPFSESGGSHRPGCYLSNTVREDMLAAMKEFIARAEGRYSDMDGTGAPV
jgi:hypothetical protein